MDKLDLKRQLKHLYQPPANEVVLVDVPALQFVVVEGQIEPGEMPGTSKGFSSAVGALYGFAYTLKFMSKQRPVDPVDYSVMALEGLWTTPGGGEDWQSSGEWQWTLMILQPDHIDEDMFDQALLQLGQKRAKQAKKAGKEDDDATAWLKRVRLERFHEGLSIQTMHIGPYSEEERTLHKMEEYAAEHGYEYHGMHHEIYLGDPRTARPENLKTVLRHPVRKAV